MLNNYQALQYVLYHGPDNTFAYKEKIRFVDTVQFLYNWVGRSLGKPPIPIEEIEKETADYWMEAIHLLNEHKESFTKKGYLPKEWNIPF